MTDFFCPLPWKGIFVHTDKTQVCCASSKSFYGVSPDEFLNSDYIKQLREKFLRGEIDDTCSFCVHAEKHGLQSIRQHVLRLLGTDTTPQLEYIEMRASNLCNFSCEMCNGENSSLISGEVVNISQENWQQILDKYKTLTRVNLTGGEPFLIKRYYELLDFLLENDRSDVIISVYTNCSVYNPIFVKKLISFKKCYLNMSIDGIERTAELQRAGTNWKVVDSNIRKFIELPVQLKFHTTITNLNILDIDRLVKYFIDISENKDISFVAHSVGRPFAMTISNMQPRLKHIAIRSIDKAVDLMTDSKFDQLKNELLKNRQIITDL